MSRSKSILYELISFYVMWLPVAMVSLFLKLVMLHLIGMRGAGFALGRESLGESPDVLPSFFSFWETASFYREDYVLACIVVPLVVFSSVFLVRERFRVWVVALLSIVSFVFLVTQMNVYMDLGGFLSFEKLEEGARWVFVHPDDFQNYLAPHLGGVFWGIVFILGAAFVFASQPPRQYWAKLGFKGQRMVFGLMVLTVCGLGVRVWMVDLPVSSMHGSVYGYIVKAFLPDSYKNASSFDGREPQDLHAAYRNIVQTPESSCRADYHAAAQGYNIIYFVLETAPHRLVDLTSDELDDLPNLRPLREASWVASQHFTTSSLSDRSLFSIFSSVYPPASGPVLDTPGRKAPGIVQRLKKEGYETAIYIPMTLHLDWERWMLEAVGFENRKVAEQIATDISKDREVWQWVHELDLIALDMLQDDIRRHAKENRPFVAAYAPQVGHAPWPDTRPEQGERDLWVLGREVVALQDDALGDLMDTLDQAGVAESTIIVFTGDHGIRHWVEDPAFPAGRPGGDSFHVPMMIHVPGVLQTTHQTEWVTSHIDVSPTLACFLGVGTGGELQQGAPMWDSRLRNRTVYFWAHMIEQVRGYRAPEHFALWNGLLDTVYVNAEAQFDNSHQVRQASDLHQTVASKIETIEDLQRAWLRAAIR